MKIFYNHPYHLVTNSPWPLLTSFSIFNLLVSSIKILRNIIYTSIFIRLILIIICSIQWWRDIIRERTFQGLHTKNIYKLLRLGIILFILSELIFFFSFFWSYLHSALSPRVEIGRLWPPKNINQFNPYEIPFLNTIILLSSGISITWSHYSLLFNNKFKILLTLLLTIILGIIFTFIQIIEYKESYFCFNDSIYGSLFYLTTGFHGIHVIIGTIFLIIILFRLFNNHISIYHHFGFEASSWYWHFVDVIWIIVYSIIYWWNY